MVDEKNLDWKNVDWKDVVKKGINAVSPECTEYMRKNVKKNLSQMRSMVIIAEKNLEASKLLRDNGFIAFSIFHLQQSIELLTKITLLQVSDKAVKTHNQLTLIKELLNKMKNSPCGISLPHDFENGITNLINEIEKEKKVFVTSEEVLNFFLGIFLKEMEMRYDESINKDKEINQEISKKVKSIINDLNYPQPNKKAIEKIDAVPFIVIIDILLLGILLYPHEVYTRYREDDLSPQDYDEKRIPIAKEEYYNEIYTKIKNAITTTKEVFKF